MFSTIKLTVPLAAVACLTGLTVGALAQRTVPTPPRPDVRGIPAAPPAVGVLTDSELKLAVDPNVNIKFCVADGDLRVNGWDRDEVRVFVRSGRKFSFRVLEKDKSTAKPNWVWIAPDMTEERMPEHGSECLTGESIEMDVPRGTTVNMSGRLADTEIDSVRKVSVKVIEGNVALRNINGGIAAFAFQGDLMVDSSAGAITIESTTGNVLANDVQPGQIGDVFRVKTNSGSIALQNVEHRQIEAHSITGSVFFDGKFLQGGIYGFKTSNGSITLKIPESSSLMLKARYGFGSFNSAVPLEYLTEIKTSAGKNIVAQGGSGGADVTLTTTSGRIRIEKQP
jgi:hypothetical protein